MHMTHSSVEQDVSFSECYDRLHSLDDQFKLSVEREKRLALETKLGNAEGRAKELQTKLEARMSDSRYSILSNIYHFTLILHVGLRSTESTLREQLRRLYEQYDALKDVKERAAERYKVDFKEWRAFNG